MPARKSDRPPATDEVWTFAFIAKRLFRLTDAQIGEWLGYSTATVKNRRTGAVRYKRPDGTWTTGHPPKTNEEETGANSVPGTDTSDED